MYWRSDIQHHSWINKPYNIWHCENCGISTNNNGSLAWIGDNYVNPRDYWNLTCDDILVTWVMTL